MNEVELTNEIIKGGKSSVDGWNEDQAAALGLKWPLPANWIEEAQKIRYTRSQIFQFVSLKTPEPPRPVFFGKPRLTTKQLRKQAKKLRKKLLREKREAEKPKRQRSTSDNLLPDSIPSLGYSERNAFLKTLGYDSYYQYQKGRVWRRIRIRVYQLFGKKCVFCKTKKAKAIHHSCYTEANLAGDSLGGLHPICNECHKQIEYSPKGVKLTAEETRQKSREIMSK